MTDIEILERANDYVGIHYVNGVEDAYISPCLLKAIKKGIAALREQEEREKPLTLDELRNMDGEPVWIDDWFEDSHGWELSEDASDYFEGDSRTSESYGTRWVAYRSKPKEG